MKKVFIVLFTLLSFTTFAQKNYVCVGTGAFFNSPTVNGFIYLTLSRSCVEVPQRKGSTKRWVRLPHLVGSFQLKKLPAAAERAVEL